MSCLNCGGYLWDDAGLCDKCRNENHLEFTEAVRKTFKGLVDSEQKPTLEASHASEKE